MRLVFVGKGHAHGLRVLDALRGGHDIVAYVESAPRGASTVSRGSELARLAARERRPYLGLGGGDLAPLASLLEDVRAQLLCVTSLSRLLPESVFGIPEHGAINLHPSRLPRYPGPFPVLWQYLAFESEGGVTVHRIDSGEDSGPILQQETFPIAAGTPLPDLLERIGAIGARLMRGAVDDLAAGTSRPRPQSGERGPRARAVKRDEPLIDWEGWPIERVHHALIGTQPWLDAIRHEAYRSTDWQVGAIEGSASREAAGTIAKDARGFYAAHPQGRIRLSLRHPWRVRARRILRGA